MNSFVESACTRMKEGYRVHLANPAAIRQYEGPNYSVDFTDAAHLAQLLRLGVLAKGYICPAKQRPVRIFRARGCNWCGSARPRSLR
ncbi:hypothetical protein SAMN05192563_1004349 [Paraburkholderia aspalathi]|uniref:Transposase n=1 Tax=Paraburkholderia aspalathi TaxID=1324617 RepID=A0A1I7BC15_9BURK|nr:hypothetical protein SAMN05192563_1004349 [Paraburkholderia aspalathi]